MNNLSAAIDNLSFVGWPIWGAIAVVAAALVAALVGLFGHFVTHSNAKLQAALNRDIAESANRQSRANARLQTKLSANLKLAEFRQAWINSLRDDMAAFQAYGVTPDLDHKRLQEFYRFGTRIELFMNPEDDDFEKLQTALYGFFSAESTMEKYSANPQYIEVCQRILKREWDVLKREIRAVADEGFPTDALDIQATAMPPEGD